MGGWSSSPSTGGGSGFTGSYDSGTLTSVMPITFSQTWNNGSLDFSAVRVSVTNTASSSGSMGFEFQVSGTQVFGVKRTGSVIITGTYETGGIGIGPGGGGYNGSGVMLGAGRMVGWAAVNAYDVQDVALYRSAAGILEVNNSTAGTYRDLKLRNIITNATTVASLTSAATAGVGARSFVTDATATTFATTVVGGGSNKVPVYSDGTNWLIG